MVGTGEVSVKLVEYHKLRRAVQMNARPGAVPERKALENQLRAALAAAGFSEVETDATDDPDRLVIGLCSFAEHPSEAVAEVLELLWQDHLRYGFWEAHAILVENDQVELLAATRASVTGHYATVHVVAQRRSVPSQRTAPQ
jgi:hypothetical protein